MKRLSILLLLFLALSSCDNEPKLEYKYTEKDDLFQCSTVDMDLIKEAVHAFEDFIMNNYSFKEPYFVEKGYRNYWSVATTDRLPNIDKMDPHVRDVYNALMREEDLWIKSAEKITLNYDHEFAICILDNIKNKDAQETMAILLETHSFRPEIFTPVMKRNSKQLVADRGLATFAALELFYAKLYRIDLNKENNTTPEPTEDEHAGHDH